MTHLLRRGLARRSRTAPVLAAALAALVLAAPLSASAFCRTTTVPVPPSYSPARGCFTEGLPLFWKNACVGYSLQNSASKDTPLAEATRVIDAAFTTWSSITCEATGAPVGIAASNVGAVTCSEVRYNKTGPNQNVIVFRDSGWPYSDPNNTLGLTTVTFNAETGEIYDADMELNATGTNLSTDDLVPASGFDLLSVVTHEAGHFLGIAHATDQRATMYASYKPGSSAQRTLNADDQAALCAIYPDTATRAVAASVDKSGTVPAGACDPSPRHGFGDTCDANPAPEDSGTGACTMSRPALRGAPGGATALGMLAAAALVLARGRGRRTRWARRDPGSRSGAA